MMMMMMVMCRVHAVEAFGREQRGQAAAQVYAVILAHHTSIIIIIVVVVDAGTRYDHGRRVEPFLLRTPAARLARVRLAVPRRPRAARPHVRRGSAARAVPDGGPRRGPRQPPGRPPDRRDGAGAPQHPADVRRSTAGRAESFCRRRGGDILPHSSFLPRDVIYTYIHR